MIYVTSDAHFGHDREFIYRPRGFKNCWEHDGVIIKNWNDIITMEDDVYLLGDVMLGSAADNKYGLACLKGLKGNIHIIRGNHDSDTRMDLYRSCYNVVEVCEGKFLRYGDYHFFLSHYPCLTSNYDDGKSLKKKTISLCGHRHTKDKFCDMDKGIIYHVELDAHECMPITLDQIIFDLKKYLKEI